MVMARGVGCVEGPSPPQNNRSSVPTVLVTLFSASTWKLDGFGCGAAGT